MKRLIKRLLISVSLAVITISFWIGYYKYFIPESKEAVEFRKGVQGQTHLPVNLSQVLIGDWDFVCVLSSNLVNDITAEELRKYIKLEKVNVDQKHLESFKSGYYFFLILVKSNSIESVFPFKKSPAIFLGVPYNITFSYWSNRHESNCYNRNHAFLSLKKFGSSSLLYIYHGEK